MYYRLTALAALALATIGCANVAIRQGDAPEDYYRAAQTNFERKNYPEAAIQYTQLKIKFPYSKYGTLAELRLADVKYAEEKYIEAVDAYKMFVQYHPTHEEVPYAVFREAQSHFKEIPDDWFFLPPGYEKDQSEAEKAERVLVEFIERYPEQEHTEDAKTLLRQVRRSLAAHDLYVARFYRHQEKWAGAAARYEFVRGRYGDIGIESDVLLELGESYVKLGDKDKARPLFERLVTEYPATENAATAKDWLSKL